MRQKGIRMFIPARKGPAPEPKLTDALGVEGRARAERVLSALPGGTRRRRYTPCRGLPPNAASRRSM